MEEILKRPNVLFCDYPTFLWDRIKRKIVTEEDNNSDVFFQQSNIYVFNTEKELDELIGHDPVVVVKNSFKPSPYGFGKYIIRFKLV